MQNKIDKLAWIKQYYKNGSFRIFNCNIYAIWNSLVFKIYKTIKEHVKGKEEGL